MTRLQSIAITEMWRQGLHSFADRAERCWDAGMEYSLDASVQVPKALRQLLQQGNREVIGQDRCA